jgi:uncharacterized protein (DUF433 family)
VNLLLENPPLPLQSDADGVVRVGGSRVTLETVVVAFKNGSTAEQIAHDFPVLSLADIYAVITFYLRRREDVEEYLAEQRAEGDQIRQQMEPRFDSRGIRQRLLARRANQDRRDATPTGG